MGKGGGKSAIYYNFWGVIFVMFFGALIVGFILERFH